MKGLTNQIHDECAHVGRWDGDFFIAPSGARLCWECTGAFVSWMLDGGKVHDPDLWAWADMEDG